MVQLLFFYYLTDGQKRVALWAASVFLILESLTLLLLSNHYHFAYVFGILGALVLGLLLRPGTVASARDIQPVGIFDAIVFATVALSTILLVLDTHPQQMPKGFYFRLDVELFVVALLALLTAIAWPIAGDSYAFRHPMPEDPIREIDWIPTIPAGFRRFMTSGVATLILGTTALIYLRASSGWFVSVLVIAIAWIFMLIAFECTFGYRSFILRYFGTSLFAIVIFALLRQTRMLDAIPISAVRAIAGIWFACWLRAIDQIFRNTQQRYLAKRQVMSHVGYLLSLGFGHFVIYGLWIDPIITT